MENITPYIRNIRENFPYINDVIIDGIIQMGTILFGIFIAIVAWLGLRHLISIIIGISSTGPLKTGQRLCHATSLFILWGSCFAAIFWNHWWFLPLAVVLEIIFRRTIIRSGEPHSQKESG